MLRQSLLVLHLLAAMAWIGGMFFAYFCLRPSAAEVLEPPKRLPLWLATLERFLRYMSFAVLVVLGTGISMLLPVGFKAAPVGWHVMFTVGLVMAAVYAYIHIALLPKFRALCGSSTWPAAAQVLNSIRRLVALNLMLGIVAVVAAVSGR